MCQQAVEKLCKGIHVLLLGEEALFTHDINLVVKKFEDIFPEPIDDEKKILFQELSAYYLNNRYADYKEKLNSETNKQVAENFLTKSKEVIAWLKASVKSKH